MTTVQPIETQTEWDSEVLARNGHPLQLWGWGEVKAAHNWQVVRLGVYNEGQLSGLAQVLIRRLPFPFKALVYVPRGPVCEAGDRAAVLAAISEYVRHRYHPVALTVEPDWEGGWTIAGWRRTANTILIPRTLLLDLKLSEEELLAKMAKKTRQYIRKSAGEDIEIRRVRSRQELDGCLVIYKQTAERAGFALHNDQYYYDIFDMMGDHAPLMAAFSQGRPVAFLWLAISQSTAFELYGGMDDDGQRLRANYALKWQTIQLMKQWGITRYDFNGLLNDGVSTFKQSFADHENLLVGSYDKSLSPLYFAWQTLLPYGKKLLRRLKNR